MSGVYVLGVRLPEAKPVWLALTKFYGIGVPTAKQICDQLLIHPRCKLEELNESQVTRLATHVSKLNIENDLRRQVEDNIKKEVIMGTWRGRRHLLNLPVRGQNTRNNCKTAKKLNGKNLKGMKIVTGNWPTLYWKGIEPDFNAKSTSGGRKFSSAIFSSTTSKSPSAITPRPSTTFTPTSSSLFSTSTFTDAILPLQRLFAGRMGF